jgi:hypothetical protein
MTEEIKELLKEIQQWIIDNDYECGLQGSDIYNRIEETLKKHSE